MVSTTQHIAIYVRVSKKAQDQRSQLPELKRWARNQTERVRWYFEEKSGRTMDRPTWNNLESNIAQGTVSKLAVWRLDRLGRTAAGLTTLFEDLQARRVGFESIRDKVDLSTAAGRLMACVLASVAAYENEVRSERIVAGQRAARAQGKKWGGSNKGRRIKVSPDQERVIRQMHANNEKVAAIARATGLSRPTVYSVLSQEIRQHSGNGTA